jgi:hypothetical protein
VHNAAFILQAVLDRNSLPTRYLTMSLTKTRKEGKVISEEEEWSEKKKGPQASRGR